MSDVSPIESFLGSVKTADPIANIADLSDGGAATNKNLTSFTPSNQPKPQADTGADSEVVNPFTLAPQIKSVGDTLTPAANDALNAFQSYANQAKSTEQLQAQVVGDTAKAKQAVADQISKDTQDLSTTTAPLFQKLSAYADRKAQLVQMNPFMRGIHALFDRTYDPDFIDQESDATRNQLQVAGIKFQSNLSAYDATLKTIDQSASDRLALPLQLTDNAAADARLAAQKVGSIDQVLGTYGTLLGDNENLIRSQATTRANLLEGATDEQINQWTNQASKSPNGITTVDGTPLRLGELQTAQRNNQTKNIQFETMKLGLQAQRMDIAQNAESQLISHMQMPEIMQAMQNGGVYKGQRLNSEQLNAALLAKRSMMEHAADMAAASTSTGAFKSMIGQIGQNVQTSSERTTQLFGQQPTELVQFHNTLAQKLQDIQAGQVKADAMGAGDEYARQQTPVIQDLLNQQNQKMQKFALQWGGGDKDKAAFALSYTLGTPLNSREAMSATFKLIRDGMPAGTKLSGPAAEQWQMLQGIYKQWQQGQPGTSVNAMMGNKDEFSSLSKPKLKPGEIDPALIEKGINAVRNMYTAKNLPDLMTTAPAIAQTIMGPDGKPHPASQIDPRILKLAMNNGDESGYQKLANAMHVPVNQVKLMFSGDLAAGGENGTAWAQYKKTHSQPTVTSNGITFANEYGNWAQNLQHQQVQDFMANLDSSPAAHPGFVPSRSYADLWSNPEFQRKALNTMQAGSQQSPADNALFAIGGQDYQNNFYNFARMVPQGSDAATRASIAQKTSIAAQLRNVQPWNSARIAANSIEGISPTEANTLLSAVRHQIPPQTPEADLPGAIDSVITKGKFQDHTLERIRQTVAKDWSKRHPQIYQGLLGYLADTRDNSKDYTLMAMDPQYNPDNLPK